MTVPLGMATILRRAEVVVAPGPDPRPLGGRAAVQQELATLGTRCCGQPSGGSSQNSCRP
jgi:hypothetical protein